MQLGHIPHWIGFAFGWTCSLRQIRHMLQAQHIVTWLVSSSFFVTHSLIFCTLLNFFVGLCINCIWPIGIQFNISYDTSMALLTMTYFTNRIFKAILTQITLVVQTSVDLLELIFLSLQADLYLDRPSNNPQFLIAQLKLNTRPCQKSQRGSVYQPIDTKKWKLQRRFHFLAVILP